MRTRRLGRSEIKVSALGLGCMEIGGTMKDKEGYGREPSSTGKEPMFVLGNVDDTQSLRTLAYAVDAGITFFDTAPAYGAGHSERLLGQALAGKRHTVILATKFGKPIDEQENWYGRYPNVRALITNIRTECEASLERLGTDYIDLYQYHQLGFTLLNESDEVIEILEQLVAEGKIRYYGWSTNDARCVRAFARGPHCATVQHNVNVIQTVPDLFALCDEFDLASIARGLFAMGFLTGKYTTENYDTLLSENDFRRRLLSSMLPLLDKLDRVRAILTSQGRTLAQGALAWVWARSHRNIPIPGFRTLEQVQENVKALDFGPLTDEQMAQIDILLKRNPQEPNRAAKFVESA